MNDRHRYFLDTNIFVYSVDLADVLKAQTAESLVTHGVTSGLGVISYQVVQEFINVSLRKFSVTMSVPQIESYFLRILLPMMRVPPSSESFIDALRLQVAHRLSWYDSLIVAAALRADCRVLYSEDLQHGRSFGDLVVENPFRVVGSTPP